MLHTHHEEGGRHGATGMLRPLPPRVPGSGLAAAGGPSSGGGGSGRAIYRYVRVRRLGRLAGLWHDLGKYREESQAYLRGRSMHVGHAAVRVQPAQQKHGLMGMPLALVAHRGGPVLARPTRASRDPPGMLSSGSALASSRLGRAQPADTDRLQKQRSEDAHGPLRRL